MESNRQSSQISLSIFLLVKVSSCSKILTAACPLQNTREMPEYVDFKAESTQKNAAEFISQVQENYAYLLDKRENYVDYVANRPGVKKLGDHGLWNADGKVC